MPSLLEAIDIAGNIITIDAMGTQKKITQLIIKKKADYILALKGNQKKLHKQVEDWFKEAQNNNFTGIEYSYYSQVEAGHHRIEKRQIYSVTISLLPVLHNQNEWQKLKSCATNNSLVFERS